MNGHAAMLQAIEAYYVDSNLLGGACSDRCFLLNTEDGRFCRNHMHCEISNLQNSETTNFRNFEISKLVLEDLEDRSKTAYIFCFTIISWVPYTTNSIYIYMYVCVPRVIICLCIGGFRLFKRTLAADRLE